MGKEEERLGTRAKKTRPMGGPWRWLGIADRMSGVADRCLGIGERMAGLWLGASVILAWRRV